MAAFTASFARPAFATPAGEAPSAASAANASAPVPSGANTVARPVPVYAPAPDYPPGAEGDATVALELTVGKDGLVSDPRARSGDEPFVGAALNAVTTWRFEPAHRNGVPVAVRVLFEVRFNEPTLEDDDPIVTEWYKGKPPIVAPRPKPASPVVEVIVHGTWVQPPRTSFSRAEVREIPGAFGDPFRAVEILPGVTPLATGFPYYFVRGAPPGNVGYFVDGVRVPLLFHLGLGPSVIHPGIIERVDLYPGAAPSRYGRSVGGVVAAETRAPRDEFHAEGNLRVYDVGALAEAPFDDGRGHALVAGRYSFAAPAIRLFAPELTLDYWDYQLRSSYRVSDDDTLSVFAFGSLDRFGSDDGSFDAFANSQFHRIDLRADHRMGGSTDLRVAVTLGLDRTESDVETAATVRSTDRQVGGRLEVDHRFGTSARLRGGAEATVDRLDARLDEVQGAIEDPEGPEDESEGDGEADDGEGEDLELGMPSRTQLITGMWADLTLTPEPGVTVIPGLRVDLFHVFASPSRDGGTETGALVGVAPHVTARFDLGARVSLENTLGIAHQPASFALPVPGYELTDSRGGLQRSVQSSAGVEWRPGEEWTAKLTLFQNAFFAMTDALTLARIEDLAGPAEYTDRMLGHAYGVELLLRRPLTRRIAGYLAYTLSRSERSIDRFHGPAAFDHTHVVHAALAYDLGAGFRFGSRGTFYTGIPAERLKGDALGDTGPREDSEPIVPPSPGEYPEPRRAPAFFRLDLRVEKRFEIGEAGAWLSVVAEMVNATLSREILDYKCDRYRCVQEAYGPISIPSLGLEGSM